MRNGAGIRFSHYRRRTLADTDWNAAAASFASPPAGASGTASGDYGEELRQSFDGRQSVVGGQTKRCFDITAAAMALLLLLPLFCLIALAIKAADRGPVLYRHRRIGKDGAPFDCLKFRTMVVDADQVLRHHLAANHDAAREWEDKHKLTNDPRITSLGAILRKSSLDELPQLLNIVKGEMSVVGPRPIVSAEVPKYGDCIDHYLRARPGLTGPWQVSGRNDIDYETRVLLDRQYLENWSFRRDVEIIARTVRVVVTTRGCY
jgi:exopolysaccharide production protein ExoY